MGSRIYQRKENSVEYSAGNTVTVDLSRNYHVSDYLLKLSANITNASSASYKSDNLFSLIRKLTLKANGSVIFKTVTGEKLIYNSIVEKGIKGYTNLVKTASTTNNAVQFAQINLNLPDNMARPWDTILNSRVFDSYQLEIEWNNSAALGTGITVNSAELEIVSNQLIGYTREKAEQILYYKEIWQNTTNVTADNNALQITIPIQKYYKDIMLIAKDNGVLSDNIIKNVLLKSGTVIFMDMAADFIQNQNAFVVNKNEYVPNAGIYFLDFSPRGFLSDVINTVVSDGGFNTLELVLDIKAGTDATIDTFVSYIEKTGQYEA